ncbi:MAG TPA: cupin domain-containing protein [Gemmatimonadales bacterium]|nr:cupin domain-containing protein [Gemmatimonadales bacterium]
MTAYTRWDPALGPLQLSTLRGVLQREGKSTAWWSDLPGAKASAAHQYPETRWMLSGFLRVTVGDDVFDLGPGDRLDLPPDTPHATEVVGLGIAIYVTGDARPAAAAVNG